MVFCLLTDSLLPLSNLHNFLSCLESLSYNLRESLFMDICLFGKFHIIVAHPLVKDSCNLFEYLRKIFLKLRCKFIE